MKLLWLIWTKIKELWYWLWGRMLLCIVESHHGEIHVHGKTLLTRNVVLGRNPNFSGMEIAGKGKVVIATTSIRGKVV